MAMQSVQQMLAADGVADIVDFSYIPFGNEFYNPIKECPPGDTSYSHDGCQCWMNACNGTTPAMDCFAGTPVCQHGPDECAANRIEACAIYTAGGAKAPDVWTKFIFCFEVDNNSNAASAQDCAKKAGVDWKKMNACIQPPVGSAEHLNARKRRVAQHGGLDSHCRSELRDPTTGATPATWSTRRTR